MADYVNPFGGYAQGYTQGSELENKLQQDARAARQADWEAKYLNPEKAQQAQYETRRDLSREPYEDYADPYAAGQIRDKYLEGHLGLGEGVYGDTGDTSAVNSVASQLNPLYAPPSAQDQARRLNFAREEKLYSDTGLNAYRQALGQGSMERGQAAQVAAGARAAAVAPPPAFPNRYGTAPAAAAPAAGTTPAAPPAAEGASDQGINPQGSVMKPFHELDPIHQAHILHYTSQLTGHPVEAVAQHVAQQHPAYQQGQGGGANFSTDTQAA
jgi:hypothetical protein